MRPAVESWRAFGPTWFVRWQWLLLLILEEPLLGRWFRWVLRIRRQDVGWRARIVRVLPHAYVIEQPARVAWRWMTFPGWRAQRVPVEEAATVYVADVRTHWKYSKRVYHAFFLLWWTLHAWDRVIAERYLPAFDAGFSTLTRYPDPDPESATVDGDAYTYGADTWANHVAGVPFKASDDSGTALRILKIESTTTNQWLQIVRPLFLFDTSALTLLSAISAATLSVYGGAKTDALGITPEVNIYTTAPASNTALVGADFTTFGSTAQATAITWASLSTGSYNDWTFNATGLGNISKTGISKFGARTDYDVGSEPTWSDSQATEMYGSSADTAGSTQDPKLVITYTLVDPLDWLAVYPTWLPPLPRMALRAYTPPVRPSPLPNAPAPSMSWQQPFADQAWARPYPAAARGVFVRPLLTDILRPLAWVPTTPAWLARRSPFPAAAPHSAPFTLSSLLAVPITGGWRPIFPAWIARRTPTQTGLSVWLVDGQTLLASACLVWTDTAVQAPQFHTEALIAPGATGEALTVPRLQSEDLC